MNIEEKFNKKLEELSFNDGILNMTCNKFKFLEKFGYSVEIASGHIQISRYDGPYDHFDLEFYPYNYSHGEIGLKEVVYTSSECDKDITLDELLNIISMDYYDKFKEQKG